MRAWKRSVSAAIFVVLVLASAAPVKASDYVFTLWAPNSLRLDMYINYLGSGGNIYTVSGMVSGAGKNTPVTGTVILESGTTARFGLTLLNGVAGWYPTGWEFTCNVNTWVCSAGYVVYTAPETRGTFTLSQTPTKPETSPDAISEALKSIGYMK
jgi:hypothetical protein